MFLDASQKIEKAIAVLLVFLMPTQLALHFWPTYAFVFGIRVDYLAPAIYLTDVLAFVLIVIWFINDKKSFLSIFKKTRKFILLIIFLMVANIAFSTSFWLTAIKWLKVLEMFLFSSYIYYRKSFIREKILLEALLFSSAFFSLIGIVQFFLGRTTGLLYILGERTFSTTTPGIALVSINGQNFLRAYSTFPHPNSLAGFLGVAIIYLIGSGMLKKMPLFNIGLLVLLLGIFLTFSMSGLLSLIFITLLFYATKRKSTRHLIIKTFLGLSILSSLLLTFLSGQNFKSFGFSKNLLERINLSYLSGRMISERFLTGEGFNTFIVNIPKFNKGLQTPWLLQPVHNVYLLIFSELGVIGLIFFCCAIYLTFQKFLQRWQTLPLLFFSFILFTGLTDHYWITIQQNILLISFSLGLSLSDRSKLG